jgi:hypothetical protein
VGAAVWGNQILLQHGYTPAQTELEFLYYVAEGTNGTIWAILKGFWPPYILPPLSVSAPPLSSPYQLAPYY